MSQTAHFVQTFKKQKGRLVASPPQQFKDAEQAKLKGERSADRAAGVVVFSVTGDATFGDFDEPVVIYRHGELPPGFA